MSKKKLNMIYLFVIAIMISFSSIGYSALSQSLRISGDVAYHYKNQKLYDVLKEASEDGTYATTYTGAHQDSMNGAGNQAIYHWKADNDTEATAIQDKWNVKFGGFCWQMIRTTDTGGVKMIYNGTPSSGKCTKTGADQAIGNSSFNSSADSLAYVGYKYNTVYTIKSGAATSGSLFGGDVTYSGGTYTLTNTQSSYDSTHHYTCNNTTGTCSTVRYYYDITTGTFNYYNYTELSDGSNIEEAIEKMLHSDDVNTIDSTMKTYIDNWYSSHLTSYSSMIEDTIFCNNRSVLSLGGFDPNGGSGSLNFQESNTVFNYVSTITNLSCPYETDKFSLSNSKAQLTYPVGLASLIELDLLKNYNINATNSDYWLISPTFQNSIDTRVRNGFVFEEGDLADEYVDESIGVRPVISLVPGIEYVSGTGTKNDPYVVSNARVLTPTFTDSDIVDGTRTVTINYPSGCGTTFTCLYYKMGNQIPVTSNTVTVPFTGPGELYASVSDGNATLSNSHTVTFNKLYVSSSGNDTSGLGTIASPYKTLNKAYEMADYNSTIYVMDNITPSDTLNMDSNKSITITSCTKASNTSCPTSTTNTITRGSSLIESVIDVNFGILKLEKINLDGNNVTSNAPMIYSESTVNLVDSSLSHASSTVDGGAIYNDGGSLNITDTEIDANRASRGGGIFNNAGTVIINYADIYENSATTSGGGIQNCGGYVEVKDGMISDNTAEESHGGGIAHEFDSEQSTYESTNATMGKLIISGGTIIANTATGSLGGGIYVRSDSTHQNVTNISGDAKITSNSGTYGGGINVQGEDSKTIISGGEISSNTTTIGSGGGIYAYGDLTITGGTFSNNTAVTYGGGIMIKTTASISGSTSITGNKTTTNEGGGIRNDGTLTFSGGNITKNTAAENGGGISASSLSTTTISGGTIGGSSANKNVATLGGGIGNNGTLKITGGNITYNESTTGAGGVYSYNTGTVELTSPGNVSYNKALNGSGGGVYINGGTFTMNSGTISSNSASNSGGGVLVRYYNDSVSGTMNLKGGTISSNTTAGASGGGGIRIYNVESNTTSNAKLVITGGTITGNSATNSTSGDGGGIYATVNTTMTMSAGSITSNNATTTGGGVFAGGTFTMSGGNINDNTVSNSGTAQPTGGGVQVGGNGSFTITGGNIKNNTVQMTSTSASKNSYGGAIGVYNAGTLKVQQASGKTTTISGNKVTNKNSNQTGTGGGIWCNSPNCSMSGGTLSTNEASTHGGGVYITSAGTFKLSGGTIKNNVAPSGGGIYKTSSGTYTKSGSPSCSGNGQTGLSSACVWTAN